uniref:SGNH/GDSL hydrolase family protein n=1 Tax=Alistipes sp. TaxID=1872444 RepID=UPI004057BC18
MLVAAVLAVGCTEDPTTENGVNMGEVSDKEFMVVTAALEFDAPAEGGKSRATLVDDGNGKVVWSEGDTIGAVSSDGTITECAAVSINGSTAMFSVPTDTKYAIYPYNSSQSFDADNEVLNHSLVSTVTLDGSKRVFDDNQNTMVAHLSGESLSFKHLCGYVEVKLTGTQVVKHITLRSNTKSWDALSGLGTLDISNPDEPKITMGTNSESTFNWVYAACSDVQLRGEATSFYFVVPPRTYENLTICVQTNKGSYSITSKNAITVNRAKIRPLAAIDVDKLAHTTVTDLSAEGVANCYVVPQSNDAGYFSFPARKINGTANLEGAAYAHLVWSEKKELVTNVNYDASTGNVSFKYSGGNLEGNALVAVMDASHNVLWSWHIWCTDKPNMLAIHKIGDSSKVYGILDRNLGATYTPVNASDASAISAEDATAAIGLHYQYGRPTPFPRQTNIKNTAEESTAFSPDSNYEVMYGFNAKVQKFTLSNTAYTQSEALSYPSQFFIVYYKDKTGATQSTSSTSYYTWHASPYNPYSQGMNLWYSKDADVVDKKADNDPCPAGYVVEEGLAAKNYMTSSPYKRVGYGSNVEQTYGHYYTSPTTGALIYIPASGFRNNKGNLRSTGNYFNLWLVTTYSDLGTIATYRFYGSSSAEQFTPEYESYNLLGYGFNVRCRVKDRTPYQTAIPVLNVFEGEGTEASPFLIKSENDIAQLVGLCNGSLVSTNDVDYKSAHYAVANDINMSGATITPITPFSGTFDGRNKTISNLTVTPNGSNPTGLFGYIENATIKNLNVTNGVVTVTSSLLCTGGIAGRAKDSTIDNCSFAGTIHSSAAATFNSDSETNRTNSAVVGGIVGFAKNTAISNTSFSGVVNASAGQFTGGITGVAEGGSIKKCTLAKGSNVYCAMNHIGGITGQASFDIEISECKVEAPVIGKYFYVGGIAGRVQSAVIDKCLVSSYSYVQGGHNNETAQKGNTWVGIGGIIGIVEAETGKSTKIETKNCACYADVRGNAYVGGLAGVVKTHSGSGIPVSFSNSLFIGHLTVNYENDSNYSCAGGLVGCLNQEGSTTVNLTDCAALVRGLVGYSGSTKGGYGGVVGYAQYASFERCYTNLDSTKIVMEDGSAISNAIDVWGNLYGRSSSSVSYTNCYYLTGNIGTNSPVRTNTEALAISDMTSGTLLSKLTSAGGSWVAGAGDYPVPTTVPANTTTITLETKTRVSVIGDSISTFAGWIPSGFSAYYPKSPAVVSAGQTYWYKLIYKYMSNAVFDKNIAWSGSCVARSTDTSLTGAAAAKNCFIERFIGHGLGNPDVILFHGGTNDVRNKAKTVALYPGYPVYSASGYSATKTPTDAELKAVFDKADAKTSYTEAQTLTDTSFIESCVKLLTMMHHRYPSAKVVMIIGDWIPQGTRQAMLKMAAHYETKYGYKCVDLQDISPFESNTIIPKYDGCHPNEAGFEVMANYIYKKVGSYIDGNN